MFNSKQMWRVEGRRNADGWCDIDGAWCGYCERCKYLYSARADRDRHLTHEQWAKRNYIIQLEDKIEKEKELKEVKLGILGNKGTIKHEFWTIALPQNYDLVEMVHKSWDMMDKDLFKMGDSIACYEFHSKDNPQGGNLHIHILVIKHGTYKPSKKIKLMAKYFGVAENFIDKAPAYKDGDFENRLNYILGRKVDSDKQIHVENDRKWRSKHGLPEFTCALPSTLRIKYGIEEGLN